MTTHHTPPVGRLLVRTISFLFPFIFCSITPANAFDKTVGTPGVLALSSAVALGSIIGAKCKARTAQRARKVLSRYKDLPLAQRKKLKKEAHAATGMKHLYGTTATLSSIMAVVSAYLWYKNAHEEPPISSGPADVTAASTSVTAQIAGTEETSTPASHRPLCQTGRATTASAKPAETATVPAHKTFKPPVPQARRPRRLSAAHCPPLASLSRADSPRDEVSTRSFVPRLKLGRIPSGTTTSVRPQTARLGSSSSLSHLTDPPATARARLQKKQSLAHSTSAPTIQASQPSPQRRQRRSRPAPLHAPEDEYVGPDGHVHVRRGGPYINGWLRPDTPVGNDMMQSNDSNYEASLVEAYSLPSTPRSVPTDRTQERAQSILRDRLAVVLESDMFAKPIAQLTRQRAAARTKGDGKPSVHIIAPAPTALEQLANAPLPSREEAATERTLSGGGPAPLELPRFPRKAGKRAQAILALIAQQQTPAAQHAIAAAVVAQESNNKYKKSDDAKFYKDFIADLGHTYGVVSEPLPTSFRPSDATRYHRLPGHHLPEPGTEETGTIAEQRLYFEMSDYEPTAVKPTAPTSTTARSEDACDTVTPTSPVFTGIRNSDGTITFARPSGGHFPHFAALAEQQQRMFMQRHQEWVAAQAARLPQPTDATDAVGQAASELGIGINSTVVPNHSYHPPVASPPRPPRRPGRRRSRPQGAVGSQHSRTTPYGPHRRLPNAGSRMTSNR